MALEGKQRLDWLMITRPPGRSTRCTSFRTCSHSYMCHVDYCAMSYVHDMAHVWKGTREEPLSEPVCLDSTHSYVLIRTKYKCLFIWVAIRSFRTCICETQLMWMRTCLFHKKSEIYVLIQESYEACLTHELTHELSFQNERMSFSQTQVSCRICETCIWWHICETYVYMWNIHLYVKHISTCETYTSIREKYLYAWNIYLYVKNISICETYIYMWNICPYVKHITICGKYLWKRPIETRRDATPKFGGRNRTWNATNSSSSLTHDSSWTSHMSRVSLATWLIWATHMTRVSLIWAVCCSVLQCVAVCCGA